MKLHQLIAAVLATSFAGLAAAQTQSQEVTPADTFVSTKSRAEVRAETQAALAAGELQYGEVTLFAAPAPSVKSRAEVTAEAREAVRLGQVPFGEA